jgi:hypothetical protein
MHRLPSGAAEQDPLTIMAMVMVMVMVIGENGQIKGTRWY